MQIKIDPKKIGDVVGKQGKTINKIIDEFGVTIDIEEDGSVNVAGLDRAQIDKAVQTIKNIVTEIEEGQIFHRQSRAYSGVRCLREPDAE